MTIGETKFSSPLFFCSYMYDFSFPYNIGTLFYGGNIMANKQSSKDIDTLIPDCYTVDGSTLHLDNNI